VKRVEPKYPSWCIENPKHKGFVTDGTGMLLCAECNSGCESDYSAEALW
jgi:hypothetical protein